MLWVKPLILAVSASFTDENKPSPGFEPGIIPSAVGAVRPDSGNLAHMLLVEVRF